MNSVVFVQKEIGTAYPWCSILQPYPGTELTDLFPPPPPGGRAIPFSYSYFQSSVIDSREKRELFFNAQKLFAYFVLKRAAYGTFIRLVRMSAAAARIAYPPVFYWFFGRGLSARYGLGWPALARYYLYSRF